MRTVGPMSPTINDWDQSDTAPVSANHTNKENLDNMSAGGGRTVIRSDHSVVHYLSQRQWCVEEENIFNH